MPDHTLSSTTPVNNDEYQFPEDYADYTAEDWAAFEVKYEQEFSLFCGQLFDVFCERCQLGGTWSPDGSFGVLELAYFVADEEQSAALALTGEGQIPDDPAWTSAQFTTHSHLRSTQEALKRLIQVGLVEAYLTDGWPVYRPVAGWEAIAAVMGGERYAAEFERQRFLTEVEYKQYLQSDEWKAKRQLKLAEAEFRCQLCNSEKRLEVHHRTYERRGNERLADLTVLCHDCHERFHVNRRRK